MKPYYYIFENPTYTDTHVTYASAISLESIKVKGFRKGANSLLNNKVMNILLEIYNINQLKQDFKVFDLPLPTGAPKLTYKLPNPAFIKKLIDIDTRVRNGCIGVMRNSKCFNLIWNINISRVLEVHHKHFGYWTTREAILDAIKKYATDTDKMAWAISAKVAPKIKNCKAAYKKEAVPLDDSSLEETIESNLDFQSPLSLFEL